MAFTNTLYTNDNLFILNGLNSESVDLIYLDPPFNSKRTYSAPVGSKAAGSSFKDMWTWQDVNDAYLESLVEKYPSLVQFIEATQISHSKAMAAYVTYMAQRIIQLHRILKSTGSLYLHCDPTASHYLKFLLDTIFGKENFRNEIAWHYQTGGASKRHFSRKHDIILFYSKEDVYFFNADAVMISRTEKSLKRSQNPIGSRSSSTEKLAMDVWTDIQALNAMAKERTGYPTQKPLVLLKRIIEASSKEGDIVLDPFAGCATTCVASQHLNRKWLGIDIEEQAINILIERLEKDGRMEDSLTYRKAGEDFIHRTDIPIRSDVVIEAPSISIKQRLFSEQNGTCNGCGTIFTIQHLEIDHIIPKAKGGGDYYENYQLLCGHCNRTKGDRPMEYLRNKIKKQAEKLARISFGE